MKKLRESANYNVIITVVLAALLIKVIKYALVIGVSVWQMVAWNISGADIFYSTGTVIVVLPFVVLAMIFVVLAVKRDPKLMIGAIVALAVVAVTGVSLGAVICMIACGYWLWMVTKLHNKPFAPCIKWLVSIVTALIIMLELIGGILSMGYWSEWGPSRSSLEAGDWSQWETEEDAVYYDEDGNGSTFKTFEFE